MGELAMRPVDRAPPLCDVEDRADLSGQDAMGRVPARRPIHQRARPTTSAPPAVHPVIGDLPQRARPAMREPVCDGVINRLEDQLLDLGGDPRRERSTQPQPDFPRITANSIACALTASVN